MKRLLPLLLAIGFLAVAAPFFFGGLPVTGQPIGPTPTPTPTSKADGWPMFRANLQRTGATSSIISPSVPLTVRWSFQTDSSVHSSPIVWEDLVFVGSRDTKVYALEALTGKLVWRFQTDGLVDSSPAVSEGLVFVASWDRKVYALEARTGQLVWEFQTDSLVSSSPAVWEGLVVVGSYDHKVYALDAYTGHLVWVFKTGNSVHSSPTIWEGRLFVGSRDNKIYALDARTGQPIWEFRTDGLVDSSPAVWQGLLFVGSYDNKVYALNALTGQLVWEFKTENAVFSSPAVWKGLVFVGSWDNRVYALEARTGRLIWRFTTDSAVLSSPAVSEGLVFVGAYDNKMYALDAYTGQLAWTFRADSWIDSSPAVWKELIFVSSWDKKLYALGPVKEVAPTPRPSPTSIPTPTPLATKPLPSPTPRATVELTSATTPPSSVARLSNNVVDTRVIVSAASGLGTAVLLFGGSLLFRRRHAIEEWVGKYGVRLRLSWYSVLVFWFVSSLYLGMARWMSMAGADFFESRWVLMTSLLGGSVLLGCIGFLAWPSLSVTNGRALSVLFFSSAFTLASFIGIATMGVGVSWMPLGVAVAGMAMAFITGVLLGEKNLDRLFWGFLTWFLYSFLVLAELPLARWMAHQPNFTPVLVTFLALTGLLVLAGSAWVVARLLTKRLH